VISKPKKKKEHQKAKQHTHTPKGRFLAITSILMEWCSGKSFAVVFCATVHETWGAGVETQENQNIFVPLSKKDKNKKSNERWT